MRMPIIAIVNPNIKSEARYWYSNGSKKRQQMLV